MKTTTATATAPQARTPVAAVPLKRAAAKKSSPKKAVFDQMGLQAERDLALNEVLLEAADLPALTVALKRLLTVRIELLLQRKFVEVFGSFELKFVESNCRSDAYAALSVTLTLAPEVQATQGYLSERDLFAELPKFTSHAAYSLSLLKADKVTGGFDLMVSPAKAGAVRFEMFELAVSQLSTTTQAWRATRAVLVAQEQARINRTTSPQALALKALAELEEKHRTLTQELADLEEELSAARSRAHVVQEAMSKQVSEAKPPLLQHLNALRTQLGLNAV